jgi:MFS family permease
VRDGLRPPIALDSRVVAAGAVRTRLAPLANPRYRLLFLATLGSGIGNWLALIALQVDVYDRTGSGWWVGALLVATILPSIFLGILFGPLVDRLSRKGLMIASDLGRLAVFAVLPFTTSAAAVVALAVVAGIGNAFFRPAVLAGLPNLVKDAELPQANALLQLVEWGTTAAGPIAGGAIVAASGPDAAYTVNAVTFAISAALVVLIPGRLLQSERAIGRGHWGDLRDGIAAVRRSRQLVAVVVAWGIAMAAGGAVNLGEIFLAKETFEAGDFGFGLLWGGTGAGYVIGGLYASTVILKLGVARAYVAALAVFALGVLLAGLSPNIWVATLAMLVSGLGNGTAIVANIVLVQRGAPDRLRGRAFTLLMRITYGTMGIGLLAAGPAADAVGARWVYVASSALIAVAAAAGGVLLRGVKIDAAPIAEAA